MVETARMVEKSFWLYKGSRQIKQEQQIRCWFSSKGRKNFKERVKKNGGRNDAETPQLVSCYSL